MHNFEIEPELKQFQSSVSLFIDILKLEDKILVESCKASLINTLGYSETMHVINAALFELAQTDPNLYNWAWQNFGNLEGRVALKEYIVMFVVQKLNRQGLILGKDFSSSVDGKILINRRAKAALMQDTHSPDWVLLQEVLLVTEE